ncbi:GtrA family protein [Arsenophonus nasoniae]|uniref:Bactoprenol-linked glucose translocase n=1 Tax=Arsenophonus nasoniae TaxID=638 RepID=D2TX70_9GAMM|nr:GtrA family protein [Arsenophonus nasoniae]QBY44401.1 hypothetical protein ArsFIN_29870 [Arsenophonus nasoniae]WGM07783.1 GtrA family protein [Arsenophonus nasoniae]WGM12673.1 GtrA family protein [Arsenophonus nasoniae]WGM17329.1 GtrA family protein [Arsenophonus nasoniae]CBA71977.1 phage glycosyltransferase [Arsenophonus nasoniae]
MINRNNKFIELLVKYFSVGVINTLIHWLVFVFLIHFLNFQQASCNFFAFSFAVTFSFFANARFTFRKKATRKRYISFVIFMGIISYFIGFIADRFNYDPIFTLIIFSAISFVLGFLYSKFVVFKDIEC